MGGLLPIMWSRGTGADVMKRIAAPMVGRVVTSVVVVLLVYPAIYYIWKGWSLKDSDEPAAPALETLSASTSTDESAS